MRLFFIATILLLFSCTSKVQLNNTAIDTTKKNAPTPVVMSDTALDLQEESNEDNENRHYDFDTTLKGGYAIVYKTDDSMHYLYLEKGSFSKKISEDDKRMTVKMLGIKVADFDESFVLLHTLHVVGGSDPNPFELIEKKTGNVLLKSYYIDADAASNTILFQNVEDDAIMSKMLLYDVLKRKVTDTLDIPFKEYGDARLTKKIRIKTITPETITITYYKDNDADEESLKSFNRKK